MPAKTIEKLGTKYGRLTTIEEVDVTDLQTRRKRRYFNCACTCGNTTVVRLDSLKCGAIASCGCIKEDTQNIKGLVVGRLKVIKSTGRKNTRGVTLWKCECKCGNTCEVSQSHLTRPEGFTQSCGCLNLEKIKERFSTHRDSKSVLYIKWLNMVDRCYNIKNKSYKNYGARGIKVCSSWKNDYEKFKNYVSKLSNCPKTKNNKYTLDRINNNGDYEPGNVRWAITKNQVRNRRLTLFIIHKDKEMPFAEFIELKGISYHSAYYKYRPSLYNKI